MYSGKIFCVGFHKTGTSTLATALRLLGYRVAASFGVDDPNIGTRVLARADELVPQYDAFQDNPWPIIFRHLDSRYPESKFILTERSTESWLTSALGHFGGSETEMRRWIYGAGDPVGHEGVYRQRYERHNAEVLEYFAERPGDLLRMNFAEGDGWAPLCEFLEAAVPDAPFPHVNSQSERMRASDTRALFWRPRSLARRLLGRT